MKKIIFLLLILTFYPTFSHAQLIFRNHFGPLDVPPLFPENNGQLVLPNEPAANQLQWIVDQLAESSTSLNDINNHFSDNWLNQISAQQTANFIDAVRTDYPDAKIIDLVGLSAMEALVLIQGQDNNGNTGILTLSTYYSGASKINSFGVNAHSGELQYPADMNLNLQQAANKFTTFAADTALLVAYIDDDNSCQPIISDNANTLMATGSLFKPWVLGGFAEALESQTMSLNQDINYVASERVYNASPVHLEPFGTPFKAIDLAALMLGNSDNTATDLLHEAVGRTQIDNYISLSGVADPDVLSPLLSVNEQFHLFFSFTLNTVNGFLSDSEANQLTFINNQIVPLGPVSSFPYNNETLLTQGSWRASPMDICANMAKLRTYPKDSDAMTAINRAFGAQAAQFRIRPYWDRVWYKGGSLVSGNSGYHVLTHGWLLENNGQWPIVLIAMTNDDIGGIDTDSGTYKVQSVLARILQLIKQGL